MNSFSDEGALLESVRAGDEDALAEVIRRHGPAVLAAARWLLKDGGLAEEAAQDAFVAFWKAPERVDLSKGSLKGYLVGVVRHKAIDRIRSVAARPATTDIDEHAPLHQALPDPTDAIADRDLIERGLARLSGVQREALVLAYLGGRTYREVAQELAIPEGTAKTRLRDGLIAMRRALTPLETAV